MISHKQTTVVEVSATRRFSERQLLILIVLVAVILRLVSAMYQGNQVTNLPGIYDQLSYDGLAQRIVAGHGFTFAEGHWPATRAGEPTAHWSYLYTLYLAAVYAVVGYQPIVARIIQALMVGILHTWFTWRIGRRVFAPTVGLASAALSAIYIYFFYYSGGLLTESFYFVGILWTLDVSMRIVDHYRSTLIGTRQRTWLLWMELGLALAVTILLRQVFMLFVPVLFVWIWLNLRQVQMPSEWQVEAGQQSGWGAIKGLAAASLVVALFIMPWTARNYEAFNTLVPLNTNAGFAFFWGNHPIHGVQFIPLLDTKEYHDLIPAELLPLNEAELDRALLREGVGFVIEDPLRFALLSVSRVEEYFKFWPTYESSSTSNLARVASFGIMLPFMLIGLWMSVGIVSNSQSRDQRSRIVLLYLFMAVYTLLHLLSWALIRYRLPVDAVLLIFAGLGIVSLWERFQTGR